MRDVRFIRYLSTIYTISNVVRHLLLGGAVKSTTNTKYTMQIVAQQQH